MPRSLTEAEAASPRPVIRAMAGNGVPDRVAAVTASAAVRLPSASWRSSPAAGETAARAADPAPAGACAAARSWAARTATAGPDEAEPNPPWSSGATAPGPPSSAATAARAAESSAAVATAALPRYGIGAAKAPNCSAAAASSR